MELMNFSRERGCLFGTHQAGTLKVWSVRRGAAVKRISVVESVLLKRWKSA